MQRYLEGYVTIVDKIKFALLITRGPVTVVIEDVGVCRRHDCVCLLY